MSRLISDKYREVQQSMLNRFNQLKANEEELNRIFIDIYGLQGELTPEVADKDVTVYRVIDEPNEEERKMAYVLSMRDEIVSLLSYVVGCMMGRYSPYVDGLLYAGGEWNYEAIRQRIEAAAPNRDWYDPAERLFLPDRDGIVPVTDDAYFEDDSPMMFLSQEVKKGVLAILCVAGADDDALKEALSAAERGLRIK